MRVFSSTSLGREFLQRILGLGNVAYSVTVVIPTPVVETPVLLEQNVNQTNTTTKEKTPVIKSDQLRLMFNLLTPQ